MADIATLGFQIQSEGLREGTRELDKLTAASKRAEAAALGVGTGMTGAANRARAAVSNAATGASDVARRSLNTIGNIAEGAAGRIATAFSGALQHVQWVLNRLAIAAGIAVAVAIRNVQPVEGEIAKLTDYFGAAWDWFTRSAENALRGVVRWTLETAANIVQAFSHAFTQAQTLWNRLPGAIAEAMTNAANRVIAGVEGMVNAVIGSINRLLDLARKIPGINAGQLGNVDFGRFANANEGAAAGLSSELAANSQANADRSLFDEWSAAANARAWASSTTTKEASGRDRQSEYERLQKSITRQVEAMKIEAEIYGMTTRAAAAYRTQKELENAAVEAGISLTPKLHAEILAMADAYGRAAEAVELVTEAQRQLDEIRGEFRSAFSSFATDVMRGESAVKSLGGALDQISRKLMDMAANNLFDAAFGRAGTSNAFFGSMAGGAGGGLLGGILIPGILHNGGVAGDPSLPHRAVLAATFAGAPRYHNGGIAGLKPNEVPAILERGERVIPRDQVQSSERAGVTIVQNFEFNNVDPQTRSWIRAEMEGVKRQAVSEAVAAVAKTRNNNPRYLQGF